MGRIGKIIILGCGVPVSTVQNLAIDEALKSGIEVITVAADKQVFEGRNITPEAKRKILLHHYRSEKPENPKSKFHK